MAVPSCCGPEGPSNGTSCSASAEAAERKPADGGPAAGRTGGGAGVGIGSQGTDTNAAVQASVQRYYGEVLKNSSDLKTSACCTPNAPPKHVRDALRNVSGQNSATLCFIWAQTAHHFLFALLFAKKQCSQGQGASSKGVQQLLSLIWGV